MCTRTSTVFKLPALLETQIKKIFYINFFQFSTLRWFIAEPDPIKKNPDQAENDRIKPNPDVQPCIMGQSEVELVYQSLCLRS